MGGNTIIEQALENLEKNTHLKGKWKETEKKDYDGLVDIVINNKHQKYFVEFKSEYRIKDLPLILNKARDHEPNFMVIAHGIYPNVKAELRKEKIAYLEGNGNIYLENENVYLWIDNNKPLNKVKMPSNRAFTKTGLKVIFHFLLDENFINRPYREIAEITQTGLGNVTYVINGLKEAGFIIKLNKTQYKLTRKKELFDKWISAYDEKLKPMLEIGTFHFLNEKDFTLWKNLKLNKMQTSWGGEPAGDLITNYLKPGIFTLYTLETKNDLIKNYRLIPDPDGNVKAYKKFWNYNGKNLEMAPPMLVYADLMNTDDSRCIETAQKIYNELLQDKF